MKKDFNNLLVTPILYSGINVILKFLILYIPISKTYFTCATDDFLILVIDDHCGNDRWHDI